MSLVQRGDIVVLKHQQITEQIILRLIGLPGDKLQFIDGDLFLNDNQILKTLKEKNNIVLR